MRLRDILQTLKQLPANLVKNSKVKISIPGVFDWEISGENLLALYKRSAILSQVVATAFNDRRIYSQDEPHELRFVEPPERKSVCLKAIELADEGIDKAVNSLSSGSAEELKLVDLLLSIKTMNKSAKDKSLQVPELEEYNKWVLEIGGDSTEKMTDEEHRQAYIEVIKELRVHTLPLWESLVDLLPSGHVLEIASQHLESGRRSVGLDKGEVEQTWELKIGDAQ